MVNILRLKPSPLREVACRRDFLGTVTIFRKNLKLEKALQK
jgi:hypothetical protein